MNKPTFMNKPTLLFTPAVSKIRSGFRDLFPEIGNIVLEKVDKFFQDNYTKGIRIGLYKHQITMRMPIFGHDYLVTYAYIFNEAKILVVLMEYEHLQ